MKLCTSFEGAIFIFFFAVVSKLSPHEEAKYFLQFIGSNSSTVSSCMANENSKFDYKAISEYPSTYLRIAFFS